MTYTLHDPNAVLDYAFDWSVWLAEGEAIASYTITPTGITVTDHFLAGDVITYWVTGGDLGTTATVTCHVVTSAGRQEDRTRRFQIQHR